ncbi:hypothetical protein BBP40_008719 [Aspergillus hancockii]|nr:hypothetical protein BBP40_008719 [Aspergillus hancockii]
MSNSTTWTHAISTPQANVLQACIAIFIFNGDPGPSLAPFAPPQFASYDCFRLTSFDKKHDIEITFLSNDNLEPEIHRDAVFEPNPPPRNAPLYLNFYGIHRDRGKERARR